MCKCKCECVCSFYFFALYFTFCKAYKRVAVMGYPAIHTIYERRAVDGFNSITQTQVVETDSPTDTENKISGTTIMWAAIGCGLGVACFMAFLCCFKKVNQFLCPCCCSGDKEEHKN
ncbi:hypothetical protein BX661DRAFT_189291 [Kickxella alabastrina]|uniref:uncharacterized protein n=1 Tax=Kickxella alabastrina TaxID=61397 RepID=UPI0022212278|nr:uncharacterized protein BX661DRAFT_189291 [Kickxella alabastrina]KAI7820343.1 hypothetical protein BX661DRAFT_189291 [Kickxella alabastrina]